MKGYNRMLTVEEIENISFRRSGIGGYKIEDVDNFVDGVIDKVKDLELSNKELESRIEQLNKQLLKHEEQAESIQDALITAEKTAKTLVRDASLKAETILSEAKQEAEKTVSEADEKADRTVAEAEARSQTILNSALTRSAASIDENNRIIEHQKQQIIRIQSEVTRFREALLDAYKNHIKMISALPKAEEFEQYQEKLEENYPYSEPVTPRSVETEIQADADEAVEKTRKEKTEIKVEVIDNERVKEISEGAGSVYEAQEEYDIENSELSEDIGQKITEANVEEMPANNGFEGQADFTAEEKPDSNAEDIIAAASRTSYGEEKNDEPKPTSIDELDDGIIFSSAEAEDSFKEKNNRQPIRLQDHKKKK